MRRALSFLIRWQSCARDSCPVVIRTEDRSYTVTRDDVDRRISAGVIALGRLSGTAYLRETAVVRR